MTNKSFLRAVAPSPLVLAAALMIVQASTPAAAQEYKQLKRLGTSQALCRPAINSGEELQAFFANQGNEVRAILADAGWDGDPVDLFQAVEAGNFTQKSYPVGSRMEWMGRRIKGNPQAQPYVEWAGGEPFEAFELNVESNGKNHRIIVPNACCNVSLVSSEPVSAPIPVAVAPVAAEPERKFRPYLAPFIGRQVRDYDPFLVGVEGGIQFPLNDKFALFGQIGASYNTKDSELSTYADIGGDILFEKGFVGLGIGVWDINNEDTRDNTLFIHGGGDTPWTAGNSDIQWFVEGRIFEDATDVENNNILKAGLRFVWR